MFTQEDYKKIEKYLQSKAQKDSEFNDAETPLDGTELVTLVQNGFNKKLFIKDFVDQLFNLGVSDFLNVTDKYDSYYISLEEAIKLIPYKSRKVGQVITFINKEGNWQIYQFKGVLNQWNHIELWEDLLNLVIDSTLPDEEDLTKSLPDENGNSYLSLKDRDYNPEDFSGLGRVILRKNIVEIEDPIYGKVKKNVLYQDMFTKSNTIYEIRYDFDLNGQEITIPDNCVLKFEGGKIIDGTIVGQETKITSSLRQIFYQCILFGSWNIPYMEIEYFGVKSNNPEIADINTSLIKNYIVPSLENTGIGLHTSKGDYYFNEPLSFDGSFDFISEGRLCYSGTDEGVALTIGNGTVRSYVHLRINLQKLPRITYPSSIVPQSCGLELVNLRDSEITIERATGFAYDVILTGSGTGFVQNKINLGYIGGYCKTALWLRSLYKGWINENLFIGGHLLQYSNSEIKEESTAIYIDASQTTNTANNNVFVKPCLEGNHVGLRLHNAYSNSIISGRNEAVGISILSEDVNSENNLFLSSSSTTRTGTDFLNFSRNNSVVNICDLSDVKMQEVFASLIKLYYWSDGNYNYVNSNYPIQTVSSYVKGRDWYQNTNMVQSANTIVGQIVDVSTVKTFLLESSIATRFVIVLLDDEGNKFTVEGSAYDYITNTVGWTILSGTLYSAVDGKSLFVSFKENVTKAFIGIKVNASNGAGFFSCKALCPKEIIAKGLVLDKFQIPNCKDVPSDELNVSRGDMILVNSKKVLWDGSNWVDEDGLPAETQRAGTLSQRPDAQSLNLPNGFTYFLLETETEGKPIYWIKKSAKWVDATGAEV